MPSPEGGRGCKAKFQKAEEDAKLLKGRADGEVASATAGPALRGTGRELGDALSLAEELGTSLGTSSPSDIDETRAGAWRTTRRR
jgi:hypothetical protein